MSLEFNIINKSLEIDLSHNNRTKPIFYLFFFLILFALFLFLSIDKLSLTWLIVISSFITITITILFISRSATIEKNELQLIERNIIDKLTITTDIFSIHNNNNSILLDQHFKGSIIIKYSGYYKEGSEINKYSNLYYGTNNQIIFKHKDQQTKVYIFLKGKDEKIKFYEFVKFLTNDTNIEVKEYLREELAYIGKKLNYSQIKQLKNKKNNY